MFDEVVKFVRSTFGEAENFIPLHEPRFLGNERKYVLDAIDSTFVSSVGKYVDAFEGLVRDYTGADYAIATVNGTAALHVSLILAGVARDELVITQPFSFIATCNAISYLGASPLFVDIDRDTLGLSAEKLKEFLTSQVENRNGQSYHRDSGKRIAACVPMHSFGHPTKIDAIIEHCRKFNIPVVEDAAESIGSSYKGQQTGTFGLLGTFSFNGNKIITSGGGGMIVTNDEKLGKMAKHLTTQAKVPHRWKFSHDQLGYNYRMPNINAAMACAQMEMLDSFIDAKRKLASKYEDFFPGTLLRFHSEPANCRSNYWLNTVFCQDKEMRDNFLSFTNDHSIMTRPAWELMNSLDMYKNCICENIENAEWVGDRLVNIPSSSII